MLMGARADAGQSAFCTILAYLLARGQSQIGDVLSRLKARTCVQVDAIRGTSQPKQGLIMQQLEDAYPHHLRVLRYIMNEYEFALVIS